MLIRTPETLLYPRVLYTLVPDRKYLWTAEAYEHNPEHDSPTSSTASRSVEGPGAQSKRPARPIRASTSHSGVVRFGVFTPTISFE